MTNRTAVVAISIALVVLRLALRGQRETLAHRRLMIAYDIILSLALVTGTLSVVVAR